MRIRRPVDSSNFDDKLLELRNNLIQCLWRKPQIPYYPPARIEQFGLTLPYDPMDGPTGVLSPDNYSMDNAPAPPRRIAGDYSTPNLHHYERWAMRAAPDVPNSFMNFGIPWGNFDPFPADDEAYVPVIYYAPTVPTKKLFIAHDGHGPYNFNGQRAAILWALNHGFGVILVIMPEMPHNFLIDLEVTYPQFAQFGQVIMRIFVEATTSAITYCQTLGYDTFVMEGISGGGLITHFVAAMDYRISASFPIAGAIPFNMRITPGDIGDGEQQQARPVYSVVTFDDLFAMSASHGRRAVQLLHEFDPEAFATHGREQQVYDYAYAADQRCSGLFKSVIDFGQTVHDISAFDLSVIETELREIGVIP